MAKEEIVGLVAAVDWFLAQDDAAMEAEYRQRAERIAGAAKEHPHGANSDLHSSRSRITFPICWSRMTRAGSRSPEPT